MKRQTTLIAAIAVGCVASFYAGRMSSGSAAGGSDPGNQAFRSNMPTGPRALTRDDRATRGLRAVNRAGGNSSETATASKASKTSGLRKNLFARAEDIIYSPDPLERSQAWARFIESLNDDEFRELVASLRRKGLSSDESDEQDYKALQSAWAQLDPQQALDYFSGNKWNPYSDYKIVKSWATQDPDAARARLLSIEDKELRIKAINLLTADLVRIDPVGTADWLRANRGEAYETTMARAMQFMAYDDPDVAQTYFQTLNDETTRRLAIDRVVVGLASEDMMAAARFIEDNAQLATDSTYATFASRARKKNHELGLQAASNIRTPGARDLAYRRILDNWLMRDFDKASRWIDQNELPESTRIWANAYRRNLRPSN